MDNSNSVKALKKQLAAAIAMVMVSAIALSSSTYAWFAANNKVSATNMQVTATTSGSLVITNSQLPVADTGTVTVVASDSAATALIPTTHNLTTATSTGLVYNTNPGDVSVSTGLKAGTNELVFAEAVNGEGTPYYVDYTVYIASSGAELTNQDIKINLNNSKINTLMGATSIDFYSSEVSTATTADINSSHFVGTLNLAGYDAVSNNCTTKYNQTISNITIPKSGSGKAVAVTMRVYVDGALKDSDSTTFVKNIKVADIAAQTLGVEFTASANASLGGE